MTLKLVLLVAACIAGGEAAGWVDILPTLDTLWQWLKEDDPLFKEAAVLQVMALFDSKARAYRPPFFVPHVDVGLRSIRAAVNSAGHELAQFAEDFFCHGLGTWDDQTAEFVLLAQPFNYGCIAVMKLPAPLVSQLAKE